MANRVVQKKSPGAGWKLAGTTMVGKVRTNIWVKGAGGDKNGSSGSSSNRGPSGGGSSSSSSSASDKEKLRKKYLELYKSYIGGSKFNPPKALIDDAVKNNRSAAYFYMRIRETDKNYLQTKDAKKSRSEFEEMVTNHLGPTAIKNNKGLQAALVKYMKADRGKLDKTAFFKKYIMPSAAFKASYPGFQQWLKSPEAIGLIDVGDPIAAAKEYKRQYDLYDAMWKSAENGVGDANAKIPQDLFMKALKGNWEPGGIEWSTAVKASGAWGGSAGAQGRTQEFESNWDRVFNGTPFEGMEPDKALMDQYVKGTADFETFFTAVMTKRGTPVGDLFREAYPTYEGYIKNNPEALSGQISLFGEGGYFAKRAAFIDEYKALMEDPDAVPPQEELDKAMGGNWSMTKWQLHVKQNIPEFQDTSAARAKTADFTRNWSALFGADTPIDEQLKSEYTAGAYSSFEDMWGKIKGLDIFKQQYGNWDAFSAAQSAKGIVAEGDPGLYKQYESAFDSAFAAEGLDPAQFQPLKPQFFSSGVEDTEFKQNINQWSNQKTAFKLATGQTADVATAAGIGDKTAGGDLRKRLAKSLEKYKALGQSAPAPSQTSYDNNILTQKI